MRISDLGLASAIVCVTLTSTLPGVASGDGQSSPGDDAGWSAAAPGYVWSFPRDHWAHPGYRNEWWYFTGQLAAVADPSRTFGFQFTVFRVGLLPSVPDLDSGWRAAGLLMGHASVTDVGRGEHRFSELLWRTTPLLAGFNEPPDPVIAWARGPAGTARPWTLRWNGEGFDFEMHDRSQAMDFALSTRPLKPLVFQGPGGYSRKSDAQGAASLYYSFTRLETRGTLTIDGETIPVVGRSWMDKEISSNHLTAGQVGWDWYSLQLVDGRELMLYALRREDGTLDFEHGTLVDRGGEPEYLDTGSWIVRAEGRWTSPESGAVYPSGWRLELPDAGIALRLEPLLAAQENRSRLVQGLDYWEGAVIALDAQGNEVGRGYVELTGYGEGARPPI